MDDMTNNSSPCRSSKTDDDFIIITKIYKMPYVWYIGAFKTVKIYIIKNIVFA